MLQIVQCISFHSYMLMYINSYIFELGFLPYLFFGHFKEIRKLTFLLGLFNAMSCWKVLTMSVHRCWWKCL